MLLEAFIANSDTGYVIVPRMKKNPSGFIVYDFTGMTPDEVEAWKLVITIPQVLRAHPLTSEEYLSAIQNLGMRSALAGTEASHAVRAEYNATPLSRRLK